MLEGDDVTGAPALLGDVKSLTEAGVAAVLAELGQPRYRTAQVVRWLYHRGARSFDEMTDLPAGLREQLAGRLRLSFPEIIERQVSDDGTRKYLLRLGEGTTIETVGLPAHDRLTVCFSTQAGCGMGCSFCATGTTGLLRNLSSGEMVDQLTVVREDFGMRVTNAVAMGQGEPFANYDAVLGGVRFMNSADGLGIGARHLTVSTCGLLPGIRRFSEEPEQFTLAVSLHSAIQETRNELMPGVRGFSLEELREAVKAYTEATGRRCSYEYALIAGVNDSDEQLSALIGYCRGTLVHVNLIPANPVASLQARRSPESRVTAFERGLKSAGIECSVRAERGADIAAACGQLRQRFIDGQ